MINIFAGKHPAKGVSYGVHPHWIPGSLRPEQWLQHLCWSWSHMGIYRHRTPELWQHRTWMTSPCRISTFVSWTTWRLWASVSSDRCWTQVPTKGHLVGEGPGQPHFGKDQKREISQMFLESVRFLEHISEVTSQWLLLGRPVVNISIVIYPIYAYKLHRLKGRLLTSTPAATLEWF